VGLAISLSLLSTVPVVGGAVTALLLTLLGPVLPIIAALLAWLAPIGAVLPTLSPAAWVTVAVVAVVLLYVFAYLLASIAVAPIPAAGSIPTPLLENLMRGFMIGMTAGLNLGIFVLVGVAPLGLLLGLIGFLAVFPPVSRNAFYQGILGWSSWLMPLSYIATAVGGLLFIVNLPFALAAGGIGALRFDFRTATVESSGGLVAVSPAPGFDLGNFSFLRTVATQSPFAGPGGTSAHETGHTLAVAALGGVVQWIDAVDENVPPFRKRSRAYGEMLAESHTPGGGRPWVGIWSP
jgi:hypothetical protein